MIQTTYLAKCNDRRSMPKINSQAGAPEQWLDNDILQTFNINGFSFDFFINWTTYNISPEIWFKVIYSPGGEYTRDQFINDITNCCSRSYFHNLCEFAQKIGVDFYFILFDDTQDWNNDNSFLYKIKLSTTESGYTISPLNRLTINDFKQNIIALSGGPIQIGQKGLIYGTSRLECFLSHTTSLYPGDADLVLTDTNHNPIAILEFKKHTLGTTMSQQNIHNYYPRPDGRKYDRLAMLQNYMSDRGFNVPLFVLYYPTRTEHTHWKLEKIQYQNGNFNILNNELFPLPRINNYDDYRNIANIVLTKIQSWIN